MLETCPICKEKKVLIQIFVDGKTGGMASYACKECQRKQLVDKYGEETASYLENFIEKCDKN